MDRILSNFHGIPHATVTPANLEKLAICSTRNVETKVADTKQ